jgi:hypothetical protein
VDVTIKDVTLTIVVDKIVELVLIIATVDAARIK